MSGYALTALAQADLESIVLGIAATDPIAAGEVEAALYEAFERLGRFPRMGHRRADLTGRPVLFWTVLRNFAVVYRETQPVQVLRVLHWKRDVPALLAGPSE